MDFKKYIDQDHAPKIEFDPKKAGSAGEEEDYDNRRNRVGKDFGRVDQDLGQLAQQPPWRQDRSKQRSSVR